MDELIKKIITYANEHPKFSTPALQSELNIGYREFVDALKTLQEKGEIKFVGGLIYEYTPAPDADDSTDNQSAEEDEDLANSQNTGKEDDGLTASRREYLEKRKQEILQRILTPPNVDEEEDETEDEEEDEEKDEIKDEWDLETFYLDEESNKTIPDPDALKVLSYSIQIKEISIGRIQWKFYIGYPRAAKIFFWMEENGYIASTGSMPRKVLINSKEFARICTEYGKDPSEFECEMAVDEFPSVFDKVKGVVGEDLFEVSESEKCTFLSAKGLTFSSGESAKFSVSQEGANMILCDEGLSEMLIQNHFGDDKNKAKKALKKLKDSPIAHSDDKGRMVIDVSNIYRLPALYYYLYWLIESLIV